MNKKKTTKPITPQSLCTQIIDAYEGDAPMPLDHGHLCRAYAHYKGAFHQVILRNLMKRPEQATSIMPALAHVLLLDHTVPQQALTAFNKFDRSHTYSEETPYTTLETAYKKLLQDIQHLKKESASTLTDIFSNPEQVQQALNTQTKNDWVNTLETPPQTQMLMQASSGLSDEDFFSRGMHLVFMEVEPTCYGRLTNTAFRDDTSGFKAQKALRKILMLNIQKHALETLLESKQQEYEAIKAQEDAKRKEREAKEALEKARQKAAAQKKAEEKRKAEEKIKQEAEAKKKAEQERKRVEEERLKTEQAEKEALKKKAQEEAIKAAQLEAQKKEREKQKQAKLEADKKRKALEEKARQEAQAMAEQKRIEQQKAEEKKRQQAEATKKESEKPAEPKKEPKSEKPEGFSFLPNADTSEQPEEALSYSQKKRAVHLTRTKEVPNDFLNKSHIDEDDNKPLTLQTADLSTKK